MAGRGPAPKPSFLRQRTNKRVGGATLGQADPGRVPDLPVVREEQQWHPLTVAWWGRVWDSPMSGQYLPSDVDGLGRVAILVERYYRKSSTQVLAEIRLQESRFGLSPLDRSRLQWEIQRGEEAEQKRHPRTMGKREGGSDPRKVLRAV